MLGSLSYFTSDCMTHDPSSKQATNNQLGEMIRSHILAMRGEVVRRLDDIEKKLEQIEAKIEGEEHE